MTCIHPMPFCVICLVLFSMHFVSSVRHILRSMNASIFYMQYERLLNRKTQGKHSRYLYWKTEDATEKGLFETNVWIEHHVCQETIFALNLTVM